MGKVSASQRNRKKGNNSLSTTAPSNGKKSNDPLHKYKTTTDPCHNGQVPACQLLLDVVRDIFPELKPAQNQPSPTTTSRKQQPPPSSSEPSASLHQPSSEQSTLAQLMRWRILWLRECAHQEQRTNGGTIATVSGEQPSSREAAKKKKRRKKKKKGGTAEGEEEASTAAPPGASDNAESKVENGKHETKQNGHAAKVYDASNDDKSAPQQVPQPQDPEAAPQPDEEDTRVVHVIPPDDPAMDWDSDNPPRTLAEATVVDPLDFRFLTDPGYSAGNTNDSYDPFSHADAESSTASSRKLFYEWLDQAFLTSPASKISPVAPEKQEKDWNSFLEFCQKRIKDKNGKTEAIPLGDVLEVVRNIRCHSCREEALGVIRKWVERSVHASTDTPFRILMKSSYLEPKEPSCLDHDEETAFEYVALEEGHYLPLNRNDSDVEDDIEETANLSFLISENAKTKRSGDDFRNDSDLDFKASQLQLVPKTLTTENIDSLLRDWFPAGVLEGSLVDMSIDQNTETPKEPNENGDDPGSSQISQVMLNKLKAQIIEAVEGAVEVDAPGELPFEVKLQNEIQTIRNTLEPQHNIHLTAFNILSRCDEMCHRYISEDLLSQMMHADEIIPHDAQVDLEMRTWAGYLRVLTDVFNANEDYYEQLEINHVDQHGSLGVIFVNAGMREAYGALIEQKIQSATAFGTELKSTLRNKNVWKERFTRGLWAADQFPNIDKMFDMEFEVTQLLGDLFNWLMVIHEKRMTAIRREQRRRRENVLDQTEAVLQECEKHYEEIEDHLSSEQRKYFQSIMSMMKLPRGAPLKSQKDENRKVFPIIKGVLLMWQHIRVTKMRIVQSSILPLPIPLQQFIMETRDPTDIGALNHGRSLCWHGWGGKRRVRCIVTGITYKWLEKLCSEWKSETAAAELLIETPDPGDTGKPSKKAKKKKKKAVAAATPQSDAASAVEHSEQVPEKQETVPVVEGDRKSEVIGEKKSNPDASQHDKASGMDLTSKETVVAEKHVADLPKVLPKPSTSCNVKVSKDAEKVGKKKKAEGTTTSNHTESKSKAEKKKASSKAKKSSKNQAAVDHVNQNLSKDDSSKALAALDEYKSSVVVDDDGKMISAQDFLIARFHSLLEAAAKGDAIIVSVA